MNEYQDIVAIHYTVMTCDVITQNVIHQSLKATRSICQAKGAGDQFILVTCGAERGFVLISFAYAQLVESGLQVKRARTSRSRDDPGRLG